MKGRLNRDDVDFLKECIKKLENIEGIKDMDKCREILNKLDKEVASKETRSSSSSKVILEKRKEDKLYCRGSKYVQKHFNYMASRVKTLLANGKSVEARELYNTMKEEVKFPRYITEFNTAVTETLEDDEVRFLEKRRDNNYDYQG